MDKRHPVLGPIYDEKIALLEAEIERLRAAISYALLRSPWDSEPTKAQTLKKLGEALLGADEQNAPTSKCVAEHMGGGRCVGKCLDPKDCCGTPLEQNAPAKEGK